MEVQLEASFPDPRGDICVETVAAGIVPDDGSLTFSRLEFICQQNNVD